MFPFSTSGECNDEYAAVEIINAMEHRNNNYIIKNFSGSDGLKKLFSEFDFVITQRYHGTVIAELSMSTYLAISHHQKLSSSYFRTGAFLSMSEASKDKILQT